MASAADDARGIFLAAVERVPPDRAAFLDEACAGAPALRQRVEALLRAHDEPGAFLSEAKPDPNATDSLAPAPLVVGTTLAGRYKLLEQIGDGGMGTVWMAEQREPVKRLVAVKLIKAGMASEAVLARFEAERQALALMDHPNIAKVLDGGTADDGRPYFVMELVKGLPLTEYCDIRRLSVRDRLGLFEQICSAVQHAHQKAVIHRDLKPSNILVTEHDGRPVPKVIDFGLAKALSSTALLTERTLHTAYGTVVGTPLYMAPEQVGINALDVDTRTDVYALGVILYELLTGSTPLEKARLKEAAWEEVKRLIREVEPPRPSMRLSSSAGLPSLAANRRAEPAQLSRLVRGELDWIVMKALEKDRSRRYESANDFAADVRRYLAAEPVQAVPPSAGYRLRKFVKRHRASVLTACVFAAVLLTATAVSLTFGLLARQAQGVAEQRRVDSETNEAKAVRAGDQLRDARDELWANLYAARCPLIQGAWDAGNYERVRELLAAQVPAVGQRDLRGFEWHYLDRQINGDLRTVTFPPKDSDDTVLGFERRPLLLLSPDGTRLLRFTRSGDELWLRSFDTITGREQFAIPQPAGAAHGVSYSPDGKWIVSVVQEKAFAGELRRWDAANGAEDRRARGIVSDRMPLAGPDALPAVWRGRRPEAFQFWDGKAVKTVNLPWASRSSLLALSLDGTLLAVSKDGAVELIDTRTGQPLSKAGDPPIPLGNGGRGATARAAAVAFSTDGKRLVVAGEKLMVWEVAPRRKLAEVAEQVRRPVFSPDGSRIAYIRETDAVIAEAATGEVRRVIKGHDGGIECLAFTRDGSVLVTAGSERVKRWDATLDERVPAIKDRADKTADEPALPSPDGRWVGRFEDPEIKVWGVADNSLITFKVPPLPEQVAKPDPDSIPGTGFPARCVFSPDGRRVAVGSPFCHNLRKFDNEDAWESSLRLWDLDAGRQLMGVKRLGAVTERMFSPDGRLLAALFDPPGEVVVWDATTGQHRYTVKLPPGHNFMLTFSTDGSRVVAVGGDGDTLAVALWDAETGQPAPAATVPHGNEQSRYRREWFPPALGPGGKRIAAFVRKGAIRVWDTEAGGHMIELKGVNGLAPNATLAAFSPDGSRLATCSMSGEMKLWGPDTGTELLSLQVPVKIVHHLAFTADGHGIRLVVQTEAGFETRLLDGSPRP